MITRRLARAGRDVDDSRGAICHTPTTAEVKSPTVCRRQAVMFGLTTPVTSSSSRVTEVWSNVSWLTKPPTVHGEIRTQGTRKPRPMGPGAAFSADADDVMYSPAVPAGAVGGRT